MKCCLVLVLVGFAIAEDNFYKTKYKVNLDDVIKNDRLLNNYFACLVDKGTCTAAALQLKRIIPDALTTKCKRCSPAQQESALKAIKFLITQKPEMWKELEGKFDPQGKFRAAARVDPEILKYNLPI